MMIRLKLAHLVQVTAVLVFALATLIAVNAQSSPNPTAPKSFDWPQYLGPDRTGISLETNWNPKWPQSGPEVLWSKNVGVGASSMAVVNNRLYTMGNENNQDIVWCLDAATGNKIWDYRYPCPFDKRSYEGGTAVTPTVDGNHVYTLSETGTLLCLTADKGGKVWQKDMLKDFGGKLPKWHYAGSPLIVDDKLIVDNGGDGSSQIALNKLTGELIWKQGSENASYTAPILVQLGNTRKAVATMDGFGLVIRNAADGKPLTRYEWKTNYDVNASTPIIHDEQAFISSGYNHGCALVKLTPGTAQKVWENKNLRTHMMTAVLYDGNIFGCDDGGELRCLDWKTGDIKWAQPGIGKGTLILADGKLIVLSERGELFIAPASGDAFKPISRAKVLDKRCWVMPVISNGRIFCRDNEGNLVCLDVSAK